MQRLLKSVLAAMLLAMMLSVGVSAAESPLLSAQIVDSTGGEVWMLSDLDRATKQIFPDGATLRLTADAPISGLYLVWDAPAPDLWRLTADGREIARPGAGCSFLHEWIALEPPASELTLEWSGKAVLCDLAAFGAGTPPVWVQDWKIPEGRADLLLFSTHADDEHLFFGGILPRTAADPRYEIQVAYLVNHNDEPYRPHELLNGLWEVGVRRYPVIPDFPDRYSGSLEHAKTIYDRQALIDYQVRQIRRFSPQVIVGQDLNGEYGHGLHMLGAHSLLEAVPLAAEGENGWNTPKLYLHLYPEGELVLNYDLPLDAFGGKTAFEMAVAGFAKHKSQQNFFAVEQWGPYDCRKFGLARTTVGPDEQKNDLFEHLLSYSEQEKAEALRVAAEADAARLRDEASRAAAEAAAAREKSLLPPIAANDDSFVWLGSPMETVLAVGGVGLLAGALFGLFFWRARRKRR